jgi:predicted GNAT family N-acyltransferase
VISTHEVQHGSPEYAQTVELRRAVLRLPLGLDFTAEELAAEASDFHLAAFEEDMVVACLVLVPMPQQQVKMRQVAVRPELQGKGVGTALVEASEEFSKQRGFSLMTLHARDSAVRFYKRMGYHIEGETFEEVGIPHYKMVKRLLQHG